MENCEEIYRHMIFTCEILEKLQLCKLIPRTRDTTAEPGLGIRLVLAVAVAVGHSTSIQIEQRSERDRKWRNAQTKSPSVKTP